MPEPAGSIHRDAVVAARRAGADPRSALLRLLVARHLASAPAGPRAQARFAALAIRLIEAADPASARRAVAELSTSPKTPYGLALHLARGPIGFAAPMLRLSPVLDEVTLLALVDTASPVHVAAIAARREVSPLLAKKLASAFHESRAPAPAHLATPPAAADDVPGSAAPHDDLGRLEAAVADALEPAAPFAAATAAMPAPPAPAAPIRHAAMGEAFFAASADQRATLFDLLASMPPGPLGTRVPSASPGTLDRLEQAALRHQPAVFATLLEKALGVSERVARAIVTDGSGEAIVVACRAVGMPFDTVARVLFFLNPTIGQSVTRVFGLAHLFESLPEPSAQHLVASWRNAARRAADARAEDAPSMRGYGQARRGAAATPGEAGERRRG